MSLSIRLYSTDPAAGDARHIVPILNTLGPIKSVEVSRTIGPAKWYELEKQFLARTDPRSLDFDENSTFVFSSPPKDLSNALHTDLSKVAALAKKDCALEIKSLRGARERVVPLVEALSTGVPEAAQGFFLSNIILTFGPLDVVDYTEDEEGQDDVALVAVSYFQFRMVCDNFLGDLGLFEESIESVPEFARLRADFEKIVGPLVLRLD